MTDQPNPTNVSDARAQVEAALRAQLARLLDGTVDHLDGPIRDAANRLIFAAQRGRRDLVEEAEDQIRLGIEQRKLAARAGLEGVMDAVLGRGIGMLYDGLAAGLKGAERKP